MSFKHLTFKERYQIENLLNDGVSINRIAKTLGKSRSSIAREIFRNRCHFKEPVKTIHPCIHRGNCDLIFACGDTSCRHICQNCVSFCNTTRCRDYKPQQCKNIVNAPFVCNACDRIDRTVNPLICRYVKFKYDAQMAQKKYEDLLIDSRSGISFSPEEIKELDDLVSPLLLKGQSISAIMINHASQIPCCKKTLYNIVDGCYLTARNIDMPRKVRFKKRYKHGKHRNHDVFAIDRTYKDFEKFIKENPDLSICEMDTVIGTEDSSPVLLTMIFRSCRLMIAVLLPNKTQESIIETLNDMCDAIGIESFRKLFGVILTDRGTEFSNPLALECDRNGEFKTRIFYCDPYCSWQKGTVEKNHEFIREIIPKGTPLTSYSQADITLMMNHVNSYPREELNNAAPFDLAAYLVDRNLLDWLKYERIPPDSVTLKPWLLKHDTKK